MSDEVLAPTGEELKAMSPEEAMRSGALVDGVHVLHRENRYPVPGTKAEKGLERRVAAVFAIAGLAGVGFIVAYCALPWHWELPGSSQDFRFFTPALGVLLGIMLLGMGVGMVLWAKWLMPHEEVAQDRHDEPSTIEDRRMTEATLMVGFEDTGLPRRGMLKTTLLLAGGALATIPLVYLVGSMLKKPGDQLMHTLFSPNKELFPESGGRVPLVYSDFRRVSPGDLRAGGLATVFPGVHQTNQYGKNGITDANSPVLLIRLHAGQKVKSRPGQESYQWGDYVAYSKICTHAGCPASLYEQQTTRLLCPCHQSQFEVLEDAKPVFGPASRPLPKLPLGVVTGEDGVQYFVAKADFKEPVGPGFWDRKDYP